MEGVWEGSRVGTELLQPEKRSRMSREEGTPGGGHTDTSPQGAVAAKLKMCQGPGLRCLHGAGHISLEHLGEGIRCYRPR